jgi:hypothetical protein
MRNARQFDPRQAQAVAESLFHQAGFLLFIIEETRKMSSKLCNMTILAGSLFQLTTAAPTPRS